MIRTEYTRQAPIRHWLPIPAMLSHGTMVAESFMPGTVGLQQVITGYKQQRAWDVAMNHYPSEKRENEFRLSLGQEVEGFEWRDEPIWEGK